MFRRRKTRPRPRRDHVAPVVLLERRHLEEKSADLIGAIAQRYEVAASAGDSFRFHVTVDDADSLSEAGVLLAVLLDGIDPSWQDHLTWPRPGGA